MRKIWSILLILLVMPAWSGPAHRPELGDDTNFRVEPVAFDPGDPKAKRTGDLVWLGGIKLSHYDPEFGGFSSLHVDGDRFTLLSDGGDIVRFAMGRGWRVHDKSFAQLPAGPGTGWFKRDRDSESMSVDPKTKAIWVGFENYNAFWRYAPGFTRAEEHVEPPVMRNWDENKGPEAMTLLPSGGMVTIGELNSWPHSPGRGGVAFYGDPARHPRAGFRFNYIPPKGMIRAT